MHSFCIIIHGIRWDIHFVGGNFMLKGKDMLSIHDLSVDEVEEILELAAELKAKQKRGSSIICSRGRPWA